MFFDNSPEKILAYLQEQLPDYPYRADLDAAFIAELAADFPDLDILEEIKSFRWYYDNAPPGSCQERPPGPAPLDRQRQRPPLPLTPASKKKGQAPANSPPPVRHFLLTRIGSK